MNDNEHVALSDGARGLLDRLREAGDTGLDMALDHVDRVASDELIAAGLAVTTVEPCGDPCLCENDILRATAEQENGDQDDEDDLPACSTAAYVHAEHRAQMRLANAGRGLDEMARLVQLGTFPQASLDAAHDEHKAAQGALGVIHRTPVGQDPPSLVGIAVAVGLDNATSGRITVDAVTCEARRAPVAEVAEQVVAWLDGEEHTFPGLRAEVLARLQADVEPAAGPIGLKLDVATWQYRWDCPDCEASGTVPSRNSEDTWAAYLEHRVTNHRDSGTGRALRAGA